MEHLNPYSPLLSPTFTHLDVSYNRIRGIEEHTFGLLENLQYFYLQDNFIVHFRADSFYNLYDNPICNDSFCILEKSQSKITTNLKHLNPWSTWKLGLLASLCHDVYLSSRL